MLHWVHPKRQKRTSTF
jgi:hypothetical protein